MKNSIFAVALSFLAVTSAFAENVDNAKSITPVTYHYGMDLDIKRVISLTDTSDKVGVVPATLVYEDSQGQVNAIEFIQVGRLGSEG